MRLPRVARGGNGEQREENAGSATNSSGRGLVRKALLAVGLLAVAYALRQRRSGTTPGGTRESERRERTIPIDEESPTNSIERRGQSETSDEKMGGETMEAEPTEDETVEREPTEREITEAESALGEDASREEILKRAEKDIQEKPAEPGQMTVDEEMADDLVDEEGEEDEEAETSEAGETEQDEGSDDENGAESE